jgi:hypothetical protein
MRSNSQSQRDAVDARPTRLRARITNHADLLPDLDGRSSQARRFRDLVLAFVADMGGLDNCSSVRLGLLRRLAAASVLIERLEAEAVAGKAIDVNEFCTLTSTTVRLSQRLGLERRQRLVTPSVAEYVARLEDAGTS